MKPPCIAAGNFYSYQSLFRGNSMKYKVFKLYDEFTEAFADKSEHAVGRVFNTILAGNNDDFVVNEVVKVDGLYYLYKDENKLLGVITPKGVFINDKRYTPRRCRAFIKWLECLWS